MASGYYKYRCKNFYSHNCGNWVWVNNTACPECVAAGRDSLSMSCHRNKLALLKAAGSFQDFTHASHGDIDTVLFSKRNENSHDHDKEEEYNNEEAPVRPTRNPCSHFDPDYL